MILVQPSVLSCILNCVGTLLDPASLTESQENLSILRLSQVNAVINLPQQAAAELQLLVFPDTLSSSNSPPPVVISRTTTMTVVESPSSPFSSILPTTSKESAQSQQPSPTIKASPTMIIPTSFVMTRTTTNQASAESSVARTVSSSSSIGNLQIKTTKTIGPSPTSEEAPSPESPKASPTPKESPSPVSPKPSPTPNNTPRDDPDYEYVSVPQGVFSGKTNQGIGSWFRTNAPNEGSNGISWCAYPYNDGMIGFAPPLRGMTGGPDAWYGLNTDLWRSTGRKYCGLEATLYNPENGKTITGILLDAFHHEWVLSPESIDLTMAAFAKLTDGSWPSDKNRVIKGVQWRLTGRRHKGYVFKE